MTVVSSECSRQCQVPSKYHAVHSTAPEEQQRLASDTLILPEHGVIRQHTFSGHWIRDDVDLDHSSFETNFSLPLLAIESPLLSFSSPFSGHIGLAPPYHLEDQRRSFLSNAQKNGVIDHLVFAIYTN